MRIVPNDNRFGGRILIKVILTAEVSKGGLYLTEKPQKTQKANIVEVSSKSRFKVGDTIIYDKFAGTPISIFNKETNKDEDFFVISDDEVVGTVLEADEVDLPIQ